MWYPRGRRSPPGFVPYSAICRASNANEAFNANMWGIDIIANQYQIELRGQMEEGQDYLVMAKPKNGELRTKIKIQRLEIMSRYLHYWSLTRRANNQHMAVDFPEFYYHWMHCHEPSIAPKVIPDQSNKAPVKVEVQGDKAASTTGSSTEGKKKEKPTEEELKVLAAACKSGLAKLATYVEAWPSRFPNQEIIKNRVHDYVKESGWEQQMGPWDEAAVDESEGEPHAKLEELIKVGIWPLVYNPKNNSEVYDFENSEVVQRKELLERKKARRYLALLGLEPLEHKAVANKLGLLLTDIKLLPYSSVSSVAQGNAESSPVDESPVAGSASIGVTKGSTGSGPTDKTSVAEVAAPTSQSEAEVAPSVSGKQNPWVILKRVRRGARVMAKTRRAGGST